MNPNAYQAGLRACETAAAAGMEIVAMDYTREAEVNRAASVVVTSHEHIGADRTAEEYAGYAANLRDTFGPTAIVTWGEQGCFVRGGKGERGHRCGSRSRVHCAGNRELNGRGRYFPRRVDLRSITELGRVENLPDSLPPRPRSTAAQWAGGAVFRALEEIAAFQQAANQHSAYR